MFAGWVSKSGRREKWIEKTGTVKRKNDRKGGRKIERKSNRGKNSNALFEGGSFFLLKVWWWHCAAGPD